MHRLFPLFLLFAALFGPVSGLQAFDRNSDSLELIKLYNSTDGAMWSITWNRQAPMNTWHGVTLDSTGQVSSLSLPSNNLKGALPNLILPRCKLLSLSRNTLRDTLPPLNSLPAMQVIDLSNNEIDGNLHDFNMPNLVTLNLSNNKIQGSIPDFSKIPNLEVMQLDNNRLSGSLPDFSKITGLRIMRIAGNILEGPIPEFNFLPGLLTIDLHGNRFGGLVPAFRGSRDLFVVDLSENNLTGFVPSFSLLRRLETLRLNNNRITGTVANFSALTLLSELDISRNLLEGPLPDLSVNKLITDFNASGNLFSGKIPGFTGLADLQRLDISNNQLTDTLPDLSHLPSLVELRVDSNNLVHSNFDATTSRTLRVLEVHYNRFTFGDIFKLNGLGLPQFIYGPQKPIVMPDTIYATIGEDVLIDLIEDFGVGNNTYSWYLDDVFIVATAVNELRLLNINGLDEGSYYAIVKNNSLNQLILFSEPVFLLMDCPYNEVEIVDSICVGDTIFVNKKPYFETGEYRDTLVVPDPATCDSIFIISLSVFPEYDTTLFDTICESDAVMFAGQVITESGFYTDTLSTIHGCDSIVHLDLMVRPAFTKVAVARLCAGDTLFVGNLFHTTSAIYYDTLQTIFGCDSVIITDLTVLDTFISVTEVNLCFGETYDFRGTTYHVSGTYIDRLTNELGCDSLYILHLQIPTTDRYSLQRTICAGDSIVVGTNVYKSAGTYLDSLVTEGGCDSIVNLTLSVTDKFEAEYDFVICRGDSIFFGGDTLTRAGITVDTLTAQGGCDSIVKIRVNVVEFIAVSLDTLLCFGDSLQIADNIYKVDGVFLDTLPGERCDTVIVSNIRVNPDIELADVRTVIQSSGLGFIEPTITGGNQPFDYRWSTGSTSAILDSVSAGNFRLTVTDQAGCSANFDLELDPATSTSNLRTESIQVDLYPNPIRTSDMYQVNFASAAGERFLLQLLDINGRKVDHRQITIGQNQETLDFQAPAYPGMYTLKVAGSDGKFAVRKLMVH